MTLPPIVRPPVLRWPDPRLRQVAEPVAGITDDLRALAETMLAVMYAATGRGLAATQIGVMRRIFVMDCTWKEGQPDPQVMINPEIVAVSSDQAEYAEGCLSLPGIVVQVERPAEVTLLWTGLDGARHERLFTGFAAVCVQHERDHLDGRLCIDLLPEQARAALGPALRALETGA